MSVVSFSHWCYIHFDEIIPWLGGRLQQRKDQEWGDKVQLLFGDMRSLEIPELVDILISELLGSFGDNELSPECLDGAQRFLKRKNLFP